MVVSPFETEAFIYYGLAIAVVLVRVYSRARVLGWNPKAWQGDDFFILLYVVSTIFFHSWSFYFLFFLFFFTKLAYLFFSIFYTYTNRICFKKGIPYLRAGLFAHNRYFFFFLFSVCLSATIL